MVSDDGQEQVELLTSSADRTSVEERLQGAARRGGRLAGRHPWWTVSVVVLLVVAVSTGVYLVRRPPPMSPTVDVTIASFGGRGQYTVELHTPGEELHVVGIVGPGLATPSSTIGRVTAGGPGIGHLDAVIDCSDGWEQAQPGDYRVRLVRTDGYGREGTYDVALTSAEDWWARVQASCFDRR